MLVALLARGHLLVEGVPGLAKTMAIKTLAQAIGGEFQRIQFTPDLVPADIVGTRIYNQKDGEFQVSLGPVFANLVLADEINRAPAKVQSALLEVMQERQVTIGRETYPAARPVPRHGDAEPHRVTRARIRCPRRRSTASCSRCSSDTPLPQRSSSSSSGRSPLRSRPSTVLDPETLRGFQREADAVYVDPAVIEYAVRLATATREPAEVGRADLARSAHLRREPARLDQPRAGGPGAGVRPGP